MRVEIVEDAEGEKPALSFPPDQDFLNLREDPGAIEKIAAARRYLPLRNFLTTVNGSDSIFLTASATTREDAPAAVSAGLAYEFASQLNLVFADPPYNLDRKHFADLSLGLKKLLERDSADSVRAVLRVSSCDFPAQNRSGYCLSIRLVAVGDSAQHAELRWGLGLARVQQALLFRARALKQQAVE
ncbi:MAG TPA: hypothetical protein VGT24_03835 [Candidatus Acidoferrales bacterium]|nr:hypothetical protein [Candidatus Acidoferrales bacterium]